MIEVQLYNVSLLTLVGWSFLTILLHIVLNYIYTTKIKGLYTSNGYGNDGELAYYNKDEDEMSSQIVRRLGEKDSGRVTDHIFNLKEEKVKKMDPSDEEIEKVANETLEKVDSKVLDGLLSDNLSEVQIANFYTYVSKNLKECYKPFESASFKSFRKLCEVIVRKMREKTEVVNTVSVSDRKAPDLDNSDNLLYEYLETLGRDYFGDEVKANGIEGDLEDDTDILLIDYSKGDLLLPTIKDKHDFALKLIKGYFITDTLIFQIKRETTDIGAMEEAHWKIVKYCIKEENKNVHLTVQRASNMMPHVLGSPEFMNNFIGMAGNPDFLNKFMGSMTGNPDFLNNFMGSRGQYPGLPTMEQSVQVTEIPDKVQLALLSEMDSVMDGPRIESGDPKSDTNFIVEEKSELEKEMELSGQI